MIIPVHDLNTPELQLYAAKNEAVLKRIYEPEPGLFITETANVILRALQGGWEPVSILMDGRYLTPAGENADSATMEQRTLTAEILRLAGDIPVYTADLEMITKISGFKQSRGMLCLMKRRRLPKLEHVLSAARRIAVLEDVENPTNVGAIFRSAAGLGLDAVILTHGASDPLYRRATRVSMGAVFMLPWTFAGNKYGGWPDEGMQLLRKYGFKTVAMALSDRAFALGERRLQQEEKLAILFGNEQNGLMEPTLQQSDYIVKIPMLNGIDSLNVAAASAVAFWELRER